MKTLELSMAILFHPVDTFYYFRSRKQSIKLLTCLGLLLSVLAVRIASIYIIHFPVASLQPRDANIGLETVKFMLPLFTWVIACYAITSISDGETKLGEVFSAAAYSMMPYIVCTIPLALLSRFMEADQLGLYKTLQTLIWIWVGLIFFLSVRTLNDYSIPQTVKVCVVSIITMLLIWGVLILVFALTSQLMQFIRDIILEIKMIFIN